MLHQTVLIVSGMLVGAAGTLLTLMMAKAMGRSVANVLFGAFGQLQVTEEALAASGGAVKSTTAEDVGVLLAYSQRVVIVPGYGLAVAQASTPCASWPTNSTRRASTSATRSTPSPGGCRGT